VNIGSQFGEVCIMIVFFLYIVGLILQRVLNERLPANVHDLSQYCSPVA